MLDVMLEFAAEIFDEAFHRPGRGITERADGVPFDIGGNIRQHVEIFGFSLPLLDVMDR